MPIVKLCRTYSRTDGVFGIIAINNFPLAVTLERPWLGNEKGKSCIPAGCYTAKRILSPSHGDVFEVTAVPNRTHILIHAGNIDDNSEGCILLGESFGVWTDGSCSIVSSKAALKKFMGRLAAIDSFQLEIADCFK